MHKLLFAVALLASCGKEDLQKCDSACRNYATMLYWEETDAELVSAPPDKLEALKKQKVIEFATKLEAGLDFCVSKCQAANNDVQTDCLIKAKTAVDVKVCTADE